MKTIFTKSLLLIAACAANSFAAQPTLSDFSKLEGNWKIEMPANKQEKKFRLKYSFISKHSALVEVYGDPAKQTTQTIFHADNNRLMATHYCARGNQPRLVANEINGNQITFQFLDVTNLQSPKDAHMVRMAFKFIDDQHFEKEEVYLADGKEQSSTVRMIKAN